MGFKITFIVQCLLVTYCLVEGYDYKNIFKPRNQQETSVVKEDRLIPAQLSRRHTRHTGNRTDVEEYGGFNFDFNNIPGGAGIKMMYDGMKNMFIAVNRVLDFGFIWDGISGILSLFNLKTGETFVINALTKMGGFVRYMSTDVEDFLNAIALGGYNITTKALNLLQSAAKFSLNATRNLVVNVLDLVNALMDVSRQNIKDILGPVHKVVSTAFTSLFDAIKSLVHSVGNGLMIILEPILGSIRTVTTPIVKIFAAVLRTGGGIFDNNLFEAISTGLKEVLGHVVGGVVGEVQKIDGGFLSALSAALNAVGSVYRNNGDAILSVTGRRKNTLGDISTTRYKGYTSINTTTIVGDVPIHLTYSNNSDKTWQHFIREGHKKADVVILYKGGEDNFLSFYNRIAGAVFIISGNKGHIGIFDVDNGAGIFLKPNSTTGYVIQPPAIPRSSFVGPNAEKVSDGLMSLNKAIDTLSTELGTMLDTVTLDVVEVLRTLTLKNILSSILSGEALTVVSRLLGNLLNNLTRSLPPIIKPSLGVANTLAPFLLNLPDNLINGIINLIGSVVKRFLGIFTPSFLADLADVVIVAALKGLTTPILAPILAPIEATSIAVSAALLAATKAVDLLNLPD